MVELPSSAVSTWGGIAVFVNVVLTRLGVPIPAVPMLLFAGSAIAAGTLSFWPIFGAAVLGAVIGDGTWFAAGRLYGPRLLAALGRLSPAVDSKVETARSLFERFGVPLVSVSKFVPGLGLITPPLMGASAVDTRIYAFWDLMSAIAWATFWLLGGAAAERELHLLLAFVGSRGGTVVDILLGTGLVYLLYRLQLRRRNQRSYGNATARGAAGARRRVAPSKVLDARPAGAALNAPPQIPGALALDPHSPEQLDNALRTYDSVIYCICPDSVTASEVEQRMRSIGYTRIRALRGGLDAWQRRGFPVELLASAGEPGGACLARSAGDARDAITLRGFAPRSSPGT
ncbi:VTT domain-containing protein [Paraburkholderia sp. DGU8]|uniref:VTT domain-containing protein n=1 Tax=Paraburkholderia sp. DGU8 TaxID=3161997 RepID=UPI003465097E